MSAEPAIVSAADLVAVLRCSERLATRFYEPLNLAMRRYGITTRERVAAFLAQIGHESGGLRYVREIWGPTKAQAGYEGRRDLGNTEPGDGHRFLGRGLIQITGRANYRACGKALGIDLEIAPESLESPLYAALSAGWFWDSRGLNALADAGEFKQITRRINGGTNGMADRLAYFERAREVLAA